MEKQLILLLNERGENFLSIDVSVFMFTPIFHKLIPPKDSFTTEKMQPYFLLIKMIEFWHISKIQQYEIV